MSTQQYEINTLVDITDSDYYNPKGNSIAYRQMQNLNSIIQSLSMRSQPLNIHVKQNKTTDYFQNNSSWTMTFMCDIESPWYKDGDHTFLIKQDLNNIPVFSDLNETAILANSRFITSGKNINTYINFIA